MHRGGSKDGAKHEGVKRGHDHDDAKNSALHRDNSAPRNIARAPAKKVVR